MTPAPATIALINRTLNFLGQRSSVTSRRPGPCAAVQPPRAFIERPM
jgi:hypothetical protein